MSHKNEVRAMQSQFRKTLTPTAQNPSDKPWDQTFLLALGSEEENLYPSLRGHGGAIDYFAVRNAKLWRSNKTGDSDVVGPTRNMTSSQIACINMLLPLKDEPGILVAMLSSFDPDISGVTPIKYDGPTGVRMNSYVELEWTGRNSTLEKTGSRGANATSADALIIGVTASGKKRAFLFEFKLTESYRVGESKAVGPKGAERLKRYSDLYKSSSSRYTGDVPLEEVMYEPFYQIVRLGLLGDLMLADAPLNLQDARVVVACPTANVSYRETITSPPLHDRFPEEKTVEGIAKRILKRPEAFTIVDPKQLVTAVEAAFKANPLVETWSLYMHERYGW